MTLLQKLIRIVAEHFEVASEIRKENSEFWANHFQLASNSKGLDKEVRATLKIVATTMKNDSLLPFYVESYSFDSEIQNSVNAQIEQLNNDNRNRQYE